MKQAMTHVVLAGLIALVGCLAIGSSASEAPAELVAAASSKLCAPPLAGDWWVVADCWLIGQHTAPAHVVVAAGVTLELAPGASLDIDFTAHHLRIQDGARVIIGAGARLE